MSLAAAHQTVELTFALGLRPDPILTVSEWADRYRMLSQKATAEPGMWRTSRTPYLGEIMDELSPSSPVREVVFMKGAQIGGSECGNNFMAFVMDYAPGPMLAVQPTLELAKAYSKQRIQTLIDETPRLKSKVKIARSRDSENATLMKSFPGGMLKVAGANSAASLRSMPARYAFLDEIDGYPDDVEGEGDPVKLAEARTRTFVRKKIYKCSTPTIEGRSRIGKSYDQSDRRRYQVPCPHCGEIQWLKWAQVRFETVRVGDIMEPTNTRYICEHCQGEIREHHKTEMLARGRWVAENPGAGGGLVAGFHLSSLYSPVGWWSWEDMARDFLKAKDKPEELKGFINTQLGETWKDKGDAPDWMRLYERREPYPQGEIPDGGLVLTAGVDVQKDRIEVEIVAWGRDKQSWSIAYEVLTGDTATEAPWIELDRILAREYPTRQGLLVPIRMMAVDTGYNTQHVYNWVRRHPMSRVMAVKGNDSASLLLGQPTAVDVTLGGRRIRRGLKLWPVGTGVAKGELYAWLNLPRPTEQELALGATYPPGYCHFPERDDEYFKQLTAEQLVVKVVRTYRRYQWEKTRDRNEALDCRIYNRAAASAVGIDRWSGARWNEIASELGRPVGAAQVPTASQPSPGQEPQAGEDPEPGSPGPARRRSSFWSRRD